jgi:hypothetical protein
VPKLDLLPGGAPAGPVDGFEVAFADDDGEHRLSLVDALPVEFESCRPARSFPSFKTQRHYPGLWWTATTGTLVGYESWLERDTLITLDFDAEVTGIASQPFWLFWTDANDKPRSHAPYYFARLADGTARVLDCRPASRIKPRDQVAFDTTRSACEAMGWHYDVVDTPPEPLRTNLRWLAGYRHPRHYLPEVTPHLRGIFARPFKLMAGINVLGRPIAVLPVLFHLLWRQELLADLTQPLGPDTIVTSAPHGEEVPA